MANKKPFYQRLPVWIALSFLSGATVMVAAFALDPGATFRSPQSVPAAADTLVSQSSLTTQAVILQPSDGEIFSSADTVTIAATASSKQGVAEMVILVDNQLVKTCVVSQCSVKLPVASLPALASHTIQVEANGQDDTSGSAISHFFVQN